MDRPLRRFASPGFLLTGYVLCAALWAGTDITAYADGAVFERFVAGVLWVTCVVCLLIARARRAWIRAVWVAVALGFATLALDELLMWHEQAADAMELGTNDHLQVLQLGVAAAGLLGLDWLERLPTASRWRLAGGFGLHVLWILTEVGDGDYFRIPVEPVEVLWVAGEYLEFGALIFYLLGLMALHRAPTMRPTGV